MARTYKVIHPGTLRRIAFQRRIWAYITQSRDLLTDRARLRIRTMARALGASPSTVHKALGHLEANGYVQRIGTRQPADRLIVVTVLIPFLSVS